MRKHLVLGLCGAPSADQGIESFLHSTARHQLSCLILHARPCSAAIGLPALGARRCHHHKGGRQRWRPGRPLGSKAAPFSPLDSLGQIRFERAPPSACLAEREPLSLRTKNSAVGAATTAWAGSFGVFSAAGPWQETTERPQRPRPSPSPGAPPGPRPGGARRGDVSRRRSPEKGRNPAGRRRRGVADETARISPRQPLLSRGGAFTHTGLAILPRSRLSGATTRPTSQTSTTASLRARTLQARGQREPSTSRQSPPRPAPST